MKKLVVLVTILLLLFSTTALFAGGGKEEAPKEEEKETAAEKTEDNRYGGILRKAHFAPGDLDPTFLSDITADELNRLFGDYLVFIDENMRPDQSRSLAKNWEASEDGLTWTFTLRKNVVFHNGEPLNSEEIKITYDRLRDHDVGAPTVSMYSNIKDITTPDDLTVKFHLENPNPDFLMDLGDIHTIVLWSGVEDRSTDHIGTGAFIVEEYIPEDRMVFRRNPNYWRIDEDGNQLPYFDGFIYLFLSEPAAQVEALRSGQVHYLSYLGSEYVDLLENDPNTKVYQKPSNTHYVVHMRSDREPFSNVKVRQAVRAAIDRGEILLGAFEGLGTEGRDTPVGPAYADYYLDIPPLERDIDKAKRLLAEAGYPDGLTITMTTQQSAPVPAIATIIKEQLAPAGINVEIELVPTEVYYGADSLWLKADFSITDWGGRASPQHYLDLAYTCEAKWNESHWCDPELDKLAAQSAIEMDHDRRVELFHEIQRIFIERGPVLIPVFTNQLYASRVELKRFQPSSYMGMPNVSHCYFEGGVEP